MSFYRNQYGFRSPYQVLVDGTFCMAALENQVRVAEQISKYLQDDLKILTTQCVILEMEKLGEYGSHEHFLNLLLSVLLLRPIH